MTPQRKHDPVNHPQHYTRSGIETITVIEAWGLGYHLGNAVKYLSRAGFKGDRLEDLEKARWYLDREIANEKARREAEKAAQIIVLDNSWTGRGERRKTKQ